jgi:hypothetical protein
MTVNTTTGAMNDAEKMGGDTSAIYENADGSKTFDSFDDEESDDTPIFGEKEDDWGAEDDEDDSEDGKEKLGSEELKLLNDSDGSEKKEKKETKKEEKKAESEDDEDEESEESDDDETPEIEKAPDTQGKKLRVKIGDEHFSLDSNAKMKVKIDGKNEEVTVQELLNNYSGKQAWDKKFTEVGSEKKQILQEKQTLQYEKQELKSFMQPVIDIIKDPLKNPIDAFIHIAEKLDTTGELSYAIEKRLLEANLDTLVELASMNEEQQEAYFLKKQNARLLKSSEKRIESERETSKSNQLRSQVDKIRETYGVSVEQYSEAFDELKGLLPDNKTLTHEHVVDWASLKPITPQVEEILKPFLDEIDDSDYSGIVTSLSRSLRDGKLSKEQIQKIVKDEYGVPTEVKQLNTKLNIGKKKKVEEPEEKSDRIDTFDDMDDW